jgi:hypothetical protein
MSTSTAHALRCPRCSAALRAGTEWCSLCYADLRRPREESAPSAAVDVSLPRPVDQAAPADPDPVPPVGPSPAAQPTRSGGKHAKKAEFGAVTAPPDDEVERLADQLLAELAATEGGSPLGAASGLVDTTGKRVALVAGAGLGLLLLLVVLMAVVGALL